MKIILTILDSLILFLLIGCNPNLQLKKIVEMNNTFELVAYSVDSVTVYEVLDNSYEISNHISWYIKKKDTHNNYPFRITIPEVPNGYTQVFPPPPQQFHLCKGRRYYIGVKYNNGGYAESLWTAE
jgi:hypothetical protein